MILYELCEKHPYKLVLSNKINKENEFNKIVISRKVIRGISMYQLEKFTSTQVFHINISSSDLEQTLNTYFESEYKQLNAWTDEFEYNFKLSSKGKILTNKKKNASFSSKDMSHNKTKKYILEEGTIIPPLVDLGILSKEGKIINSKYDKYKQINRFIELVNDVLKSYSSDTIEIIDFGCGKSYLTFVLYHYLVELKHMNVKITGLDLKEKVINNCNSIAQKYGYNNLHFKLGNINGYTHDAPVDMVITLHACDTATDYALYNAITWDAKIIMSVPCCQHEINSQIKSESLSLITRYGLIKERTSALLTDAIRANLLEYCGYKTDILEFIDLEHSPKNILLRAVKSNTTNNKRDELLNEVKRTATEFNLSPTLLNLINQNLIDK